jgi:hypothetical protein
MNESCKHGIPWKHHCAQCEFALALQTEVRYGKEVDEARKVIEEAQKREWESGDA